VHAAVFQVVCHLRTRLDVLRGLSDVDRLFVFNRGVAVFHDAFREFAFANGFPHLDETRGIDVGITRRGLGDRAAACGQVRTARGRFCIAVKDALAARLRTLHFALGAVLTIEKLAASRFVDLVFGLHG